MAFEGLADKLQETFKKLKGKGKLLYLKQTLTLKLLKNL